MLQSTSIDLKLCHHNATVHTLLYISPAAVWAMQM